jgi:hypothetical protein
MVNKTFLPPARHPLKTSNSLQNRCFLNWHGFRCVVGEPRLGRAKRLDRSAKCLGGPKADHRRGEPPVQNTLLIGLSRQATLERQLDVVANNVANVNTTGFKADRSLFQEYLMPGAHEDNFVAATASSATFRTAPPSTIFPKAPLSRPRTRSTSRSTAPASWWCRRPPANATPATAACR